MRLLLFKQRIKYIFARAKANLKKHEQDIINSSRESLMDPGDLDLICTSKMLGKDFGEANIPKTQRYIAEKNHTTGLYNIGTQAQFENDAVYQRMAENLTLYEALQILKTQERAYIESQFPGSYNPNKIKEEAGYNHPLRVKQMLVDFPLSTYFPETEQGAEALAFYKDQQHLKAKDQKRKMPANVTVRHKI